MSVARPDRIISRIRTANSESPIAVFRTPQDGCLNAVPAMTMRTQALILAGDPNLVGVFDASHIGKIEGTIAYEATQGVRRGGWIGEE